MYSSTKALKRSLHHHSHRIETRSMTTTISKSNATWLLLPRHTHFSKILLFPTPNLTLRYPFSQRTHNFHSFASPKSESSTVLVDPDRPDLFYHLLEPPTHISRTYPVYGISFIDSLPSFPGLSKAESPTIIGYLPAAVDNKSTQVEGEIEEAGLNDFKENPKFREILHVAIKEGLREGVDDIQINGALQLHQGWMHIHDDRNVPSLGRIGDPDDIIATVLVDDGKILADTYQPMPAYRLCTSDGVLKLTEGLARKVKDVLLKQ